MKRKRKKNLNEAIKEPDDLMAWNNKYREMIESLPRELRELIHFPEYIVTDTIDKTTENITLSLLNSEAQRTNFKDELMLKFLLGILKFYEHLKDTFSEELGSAYKSRDSPKTP